MTATRNTAARFTASRRTASRRRSTTPAPVPVQTSRRRLNLAEWYYRPSVETFTASLQDAAARVTYGTLRKLYSASGEHRIFRAMCDLPGIGADYVSTALCAFLAWLDNGGTTSDAYKHAAQAVRAAVYASGARGRGGCHMVVSLDAAARYAVRDPADQIAETDAENTLARELSRHFSPAERQIFGYMRRGFTPTEIAARVNKSPSLVTAHIAKIRAKSRKFLESMPGGIAVVPARQ